MPDRHKIASLRISDPPTHVVALSGEHDISTLPDVEEALAEAVASGEPVIVDLHRATFVDTAILCSIIDAHHRPGAVLLRRRYVAGWRGHTPVRHGRCEV